MKEAQQQIMAMAQARKPTIQQSADVRFVSWSRIPELLLDVAMTKLFRIEVWRIRWQGFDDDVSVLTQIGVSQLAGVEARPIPNQNETYR